MTRNASVDLRKRQYVVSSASQTTGGTWIGNGEFEVLDETVSEDDLGAAVARMLSASRQGVPMPNLRTGPSPFAPVLQHLGLRSYGAYMKGTRHVEVIQDEPATVVTPYSNCGREGFLGVPEAEVQLTDPTDAELGQAIRAALTVAT